MLYNNYNPKCYEAVICSRYLNPCCGLCPLTIGHTRLFLLLLQLLNRKAKNGPKPQGICSACACYHVNLTWLLGTVPVEQIVEYSLQEGVTPQPRDLLPSLPVQLGEGLPGVTEWAKLLQECHTILLHFHVSCTLPQDLYSWVKKWYTQFQPKNVC